MIKFIFIFVPVFTNIISINLILNFMTEQEKIDLAVQKFLNEEGTLSEIRL